MILGTLFDVSWVPFWHGKSMKNRLILGRFLGRIQDRFRLPEWFQNSSKSRPGRTLKTLISHGRYCKNEGMGPSCAIWDVFKKSFKFHLNFNGFWEAFRTDFGTKNHVETHPKSDGKCIDLLGFYMNYRYILGP